MIVVDASVVIAVLDDTDVLHRRAVEALARVRSDLILPVSAYAETMVNPHRRGIAAAVRETIDLVGLMIEPLTDAMADRAAALRAGHPSMRLGDALVLGTAEIIDAERVLTGDARWAAWSDRVVLVQA